MLAQLMEICWHRLEKPTRLRFLTNVSRVLSRLLEIFIQVACFEILNWFILITKLLILGTVHCVRWNSCGDMLASASSDRTVKLLDFKTEKVIHTEENPESCNLLLVPDHIICLIISYSVFNMLHLIEGPSGKEKWIMEELFIIKNK